MPGPGLDICSYETKPDLFVGLIWCDGVLFLTTFELPLYVPGPGASDVFLSFGLPVIRAACLFLGSSTVYEPGAGRLNCSFERKLLRFVGLILKLGTLSLTLCGSSL